MKPAAAVSNSISTFSDPRLWAFDEARSSGGGHRGRWYMDADFSPCPYMRRMRSALRWAIFSLSISLIGSWFRK